MIWALRNWQGLAVGIALGAASGLTIGYFKGRASVQISTLKETVKAHETRGKIEDDVSRRDAERLCLDLGGMRERCAELRRMEAPASGQ